MPLHIGANRAAINPAAVAFSPYGAMCKAASQNPGNADMQIDAAMVTFSPM